MIIQNIVKQNFHIGIFSRNRFQNSFENNSFVAVERTKKPSFLAHGVFSNTRVSGTDRAENLVDAGTHRSVQANRLKNAPCSRRWLSFGDDSVNQFVFETGFE